MSALLDSSPTSLNTRSFSCGSSGHHTSRPNKLVKSKERNRMIGGTVYQLCHFGHENHIANTVDSVYYGNLRDISDHCGSVIIGSRMLQNRGMHQQNNSNAKGSV